MNKFHDLAKLINKTNLTYYISLYNFVSDYIIVAAIPSTAKAATVSASACSGFT